VRVIRLVLVICIAALIVIGLAIRSFENTLFGILAVAGFWGFLWFVRYAMRVIRRREWRPRAQWRS
jgi:hypothetical protein